MAIADKLSVISANEKTISDNVRRVYDAGVAEGRTQGGGTPDTDIFLSIIDGSVMEIPYSVFYGVTSIGSFAFYERNNLHTVHLPSNVSSIANAAFGLCSNLKELYIQDLESFLMCKFAGGTSNPLGSSGGSMFVNGQLVEHITVPPTVSKIGIYSLYKNTSLKSVHIGSSVRSIGSYAFGYCSSLTAVTIDDGLQTIDNNAFSSSGILDLDLPGTLTSIGGYIINGTPIAKIRVRSTTPPTLNSNSFFQTSKTLSSIVVPKGCADAYKSATNWSAYADKITEATE